MAFALGTTLFVVLYTAFLVLSIFRAYVHLQYGLRPFNLGKLFHCLLVLFLIFRLGWFLEVAIDPSGSMWGYIINRITFCLFFTCFSVLPLKWAHILFQTKPRFLYFNIAALNSVLYLFTIIFSIFLATGDREGRWYDILSVAISIYCILYAVLYGVVGGMILARVKKFPATVTNIQRTIIQLNILLVLCVSTFALRGFLFAYRPLSGKELPFDLHIWLLVAYIIPDLFPTIIQLYVMRQPVLSKAEWETLEDIGAEATFTGRKKRKRRVTVVNEIDRLAYGYDDGEWGRTIDEWGGGSTIDVDVGETDSEYNSVEMVAGTGKERKVSSDRDGSSDEDEDIQTVSQRPVRLRGTSQSPLTILQYPVPQPLTAQYLVDLRDPHRAIAPVNAVRFLKVTCSSLPAKALLQVVVFARQTSLGPPSEPTSAEATVESTLAEPAGEASHKSDPENSRSDVSLVDGSGSGGVGTDGEDGASVRSTGSAGQDEEQFGHEAEPEAEEEADPPLIEPAPAPVVALSKQALAQRTPYPWHEVARTEVSVNTPSPVYVQLIPLTLSGIAEIDQGLELKFVVSRVDPGDLRAVVPVAGMRCSLADILDAHSTGAFSKPLLPSAANAKGPDKERLSQSAFMSVSLPATTDAFCNAFLEPDYTTKCYLFETAEKAPLPVLERMKESPFAFPLAYDVLLLRWPYWEEKLKGLEDMVKQGHLPSAAQHQHIQGVASALGMGAFLDEVKNDLDAQQAKQHVEAMHHYVKRLLKSYTDILPLYQSYVTEKKAMQFKPSVYKDDPSLRMVATNLHTQEMLVDREDTDRGKPLTSYVTVTTGAPAAHVYGFKEGGLRQQEDKIKKVNTQLLLRKNRSVKGPSRADHLEIASLSRRAESMKLTLVAREDVVISQALSSLTAAFALTLQDFLELPHILKMYAQVGFLVCWESLLSTSGDEKGMLGDMANAMKLLRSLHFRLIDAKSLEEFHPHSDAVSSVQEPNADRREKTPFVKSVQVLVEPDSASDQRDTPGNVGRRSDVAHSMSHLQNRHLRAVSSEPHMAKGHQRHVSYNPTALRMAAESGKKAGGGGQGHKIILELAVESEYFNKLPLSLRNVNMKTHLVLFTQGINEQQTIANAIGSAAIQSEINNTSWIQLKAYYANYKSYRERVQPLEPEAWEKEVSLLQLEYIMDQFESTLRVSRSGKKNTAVLTESEDLARALRGGRLTSCKSAKDRTSMAVTIEQARILHREHKLSRKSMSSAADVMRSAGVRLINAFKNTGKEKYAFNSFQLKFLPRMYRPEAMSASEGVKT